MYPGEAGCDLAGNFTTTKTKSFRHFGHYDFPHLCHLFSIKRLKELDIIGRCRITRGEGGNNCTKPIT